MILKCCNTGVVYILHICILSFVNALKQRTLLEYITILLEVFPKFLKLILKNSYLQCLMSNAQTAEDPVNSFSAWSTLIILVW